MQPKGERDFKHNRGALADSRIAGFVSQEEVGFGAPGVWGRSARNANSVARSGTRIKETTWQSRTSIARSSSEGSWLWAASPWAQRLPTQAPYCDLDRSVSAKTVAKSSRWCREIALNIYRHRSASRRSRPISANTSSSWPRAAQPHHSRRCISHGSRWPTLPRSQGQWASQAPLSGANDLVAEARTGSVARTKYSSKPSREGPAAKLPGGRDRIVDAGHQRGNADLSTPLPRCTSCGEHREVWLPTIEMPDGVCCVCWRAGDGQESCPTPTLNTGPKRPGTISDGRRRIKW